MIQLYTVPHCEASRRARKWLNHQGLDYQEYNLLLQGPNIRALLYRLLPLLEGEVSELLATGTKAYRPVKRQLANISLSHWVDYIVEHPELIKHPIICDEVKLQVGFHPEDIRRFIPHTMRQMSCRLVRERLNHQE